MIWGKELWQIRCGGGAPIAKFWWDDLLGFWV